MITIKYLQMKQILELDYHIRNWNAVKQTNQTNLQKVCCLGSNIVTFHSSVECFECRDVTMTTVKKRLVCKLNYVRNEILSIIPLLDCQLFSKKLVYQIVYSLNFGYKLGTNTFFTAIGNIGELEKGIKFIYKTNRINYQAFKTNFSK